MMTRKPIFNLDIHKLFYNTYLLLRLSIISRQTIFFNKKQGKHRFKATSAQLRITDKILGHAPFFFSRMIQDLTDPFII